MDQPKKILHLITGLNTGGAEMVLYRLLSRIDRDQFESKVLSLTDIGPVGEKIKKIGVPVDSLNLARRWPNPLKFLKLVGKIKKSNCDLVQTWMYHADLIGGLATRLAGSAPLVWNIRHSDFVKKETRWTTRLVVRLCALLSHRLPTKIVGCSQAAGKIHIQLGYPPEKMHVIPNGFDLDIFKPDPEAYRRFREELHIPQYSILIGLIGRFHPQKDHLTFIRAASKFARKFSHATFVLCGDGMTWENPKLKKWIEEDQFRERFFLLGRRNDIPRIMAALDIATSSSLFGEGFSNTIGEAMACGVPCVVTNIGDSASLVGDTGIVISPSDPDQLSFGWKRLIQLDKKEKTFLGQKARGRIKEYFSLPLVVRNYENLYSEIILKHELTSTTMAY